MKKKALLIITIIVMCLLCVACKGEQGLRGEQGLQGVQGEQGLPGRDGVDGKDGVTPTISINSDGYWVINGNVLPIKAIGQDGEDGITPTISISDDGYWVLNNQKTQHKAVATNGTDGRGIESMSYDNDGNLVVKYTDGSSETLVLPPKEEHECDYGEPILFNDKNENCARALTYKSCKECGNVVWQMGTSDSHDWQTQLSFDGKYHYYKCNNCIQVKDIQKHTLDDNDTCEICKQFIGKVEYEVCEDGQGGKYARVIKCTSIADYVVVDSEYEGVPVTEIYDWGMDNNVRSVRLPDSITAICEGAFMMSKVEEINLPDGLKTIGAWAFLGSELSSLHIPASVESIGEDAFNEIENFTLTVDEDSQYFKVVDDNLYSADMTALYWYNSNNARTKFVIPNTVTTIKGYAFCKPKYLKEIIIPSSVTFISQGAFSGYGSEGALESIVFEVPTGWIIYEKDDMSDAKEKTFADEFSDNALYIVMNCNSCNIKRIIE